MANILGLWGTQCSRRWTVEPSFRIFPCGSLDGGWCLGLWVAPAFLARSWCALPKETQLKAIRKPPSPVPYNSFPLHLFPLLIINWSQGFSKLKNNPSYQKRDAAVLMSFRIKSKPLILASKLSSAGSLSLSSFLSVPGMCNQADLDFGVS